MDEDIAPRALVPRAQGEIEQYRKFSEEGLEIDWALPVRIISQG